jgi:hypothetical protein
VRTPNTEAHQVKIGFKRLIPALLLALGILVASAVATISTESRLFALVAPLLMSVFMMAAYAAEHLLGIRTARNIGVMLTLGAIFFVAGAIASYSSPADVAGFIPLIGAGGIVMLNTSGSCETKRAGERCAD